MRRPAWTQPTEPRWGATLLVAALLVVTSASPTTARGGTPDNVGLWGDPFEEGHSLCDPALGEVAVELCKPAAQGAAMLPDGRVVYYDGMEAERHSGTPDASSATGRSRMLDLRSGTPEFVAPAPEGEFADGGLSCADLVNLPDGRILAVGGGGSSGWATTAGNVGGDPVAALDREGLANTALFDWRTGTWQAASPMHHGRWYGAAVTLADGKVLVAGGATRVVSAAEPGQVRRAETYDPATDIWTENYTGPDSEVTLPLQPRLFLAPNGKVFYNAVGQMWGPFGHAPDQALYGFQRFFDPETAQWETVGRPSIGARSGAASVALMMEPPYDQMTILTFGGTLGSPPGSAAAVPLSTLTTIDRDGNVVNNITGDLLRARWFASGVLLPDGSVLAVGGADTDDVLVPGSAVAVHSAEQFNPARGEWTEMADHTRDRAYHSTALLLPDMRVLLGGHAPVGGGHLDEVPDVFSNRDADPTFEIYSPRYLFRGPRPVISWAQAGIAYGERFQIRTEEADSVVGVVLMKLPSPQHAVDSDQRALRLPYGRTGSNTVEAIAPPDGAVAPPGYYYLVIIKRSIRGLIPSVARIVKVSDTSDHTEAFEPFPDDSSKSMVGTAHPAGDRSAAAAVRRTISQFLGQAKYAIPQEPVSVPARDPAAGPRSPADTGRHDSGPGWATGWRTVRPGVL